MINIEEYINNLISDGLDNNHWFMTKQTMSDYYFPIYIGYIVNSFHKHHLENQNFQSYYTYCFKNNEETSLLYPKQTESENTYRNAIIAEFLGLVDRTDLSYAHAKVTDAYTRLSKYIKKAEDVTTYRQLVDRQIEKICLNVIKNARKYEEVKNVTIFPIIFLYKILVGLYEIYKDSKLSYNEFSIFIMRSKQYSDYNDVLDLIKQYRQHNYSADIDIKINEIINHQSSKNVRFDTLIGSLQHIEYVKGQYFKIRNNQESFDYIRNVISLFEHSQYFNMTDKNVLKKFMQSSLYFKGEIDDTNIENTLSFEEFVELIESEDEFLCKLKLLAEQYGEKGTTNITSEVRLPVVQQIFRDKLIDAYGQKCQLCGITNKELLIASHIKSASVSNIYEKADLNNGLLLCANHDKLFDKFLITFNFYDGKILISKKLTPEERVICHLNDDSCLPSEMLTDERIQYLMWHNDEFHKKETEK